LNAGERSPAGDDAINGEMPDSEFLPVSKKEGARSRRAHTKLEDRGKKKIKGGGVPT